MNQTIVRLTLALLLFQLPACLSPKGDTVQEKRASALEMRDEVLTQLAERWPAARERLGSSAGYLVIHGFSIHPGLLTFASGFGVVIDNKTGDVSHQKFFRFAAGPGLAIKSFNVVVLLEDEETVRALASGGTGFGYLAEAALKFGDFGGGVSAYGVSKGDEAYLWTETGFALELAAGIGKLNENDDLNE